MNKTPSPYEVYSKRNDYHRGKEAHFKNRVQAISKARLFIGISFFLILLANNFYTIDFVGFTLTALFIVFLILIFIYSRERAKFNKHGMLSRLNEDSMHRVKGEINKIKGYKSLKLDEQYKNDSYLNELGVIGEHSLLKYIGTIYTPAGLDAFLGWITNTCNPSSIIRRQDSIKELSAEVDDRQSLQSTLYALFHDNSSINDRGSYKDFIKWANDNNNFSLTVMDKIGAVISLLFPATFVALLVIDPSMVLYSFPLLVMNLSILIFNRNNYIKEFDKVDIVEPEIKKYHIISKIISERKFTTAHLIDIQEKLCVNNINAHNELSKLLRTISWANLRNGGMFYFLLNIIFLYDLHISRILHSWLIKNHRYVEDWMKCCGQFEALNSLSEIGFNNPDWCYPEYSKDLTAPVQAKSLGHPLIASRVRIRNDVNLGGDKSFLLITGSNMSGKSTLLKTLGINVSLAKSGAPICASSFKMPPIDVYSSFRASDSLEEGQSLFMAEIIKIKDIIESTKKDSSAVSLVLLDEILHGTNSKERHIAVTHIIKDLASRNCIGAISTHDLNLAEEKDINNYFDYVYLKESISHSNSKVIMSFDYKLHKGVATTTNALKIIEAMGITSSDNNKTVIEMDIYNKVI